MLLSRHLTLSLEPDACWLAGTDAGLLARSLACRIDGKGEICVREDEESEGSEGTIGGKESDRNGEKVSHPDRISPTSLAPFSLCVFSCSRAALSLAVAAAAAVGGEEEQRTNHGAKEPCWASYFHFEHELSGGLWVGREQGIVCVCVWRLFQRGSSASASSGASSLVLALVAFALLVLLTSEQERRRATFSFPFSGREFGGCEVEGFH